MKMVKNLITSIIIGSTALAVPMMANAKSADGAYKVSDKPITLDIHFHTKKYVYNNDWPVEKEAARLTNVHFVICIDQKNIQRDLGMT